MVSHKPRRHPYTLGTVKTTCQKAFSLVALLAAILALSACISHGRTSEIQPPVDYPDIVKKDVSIALLGGTGMVGSFILSAALQQGYDVRVLARTPSKLEALTGYITIVQGDARDPLAIDTLLRGSDIVISALGPVKADGSATKMLSTTVTGLVIQSMLAHNIQRYIVVSGAALEMPGDDRNMTGWLAEQSASIALRDTLTDKQSEYQLLVDSTLAWTLVRCPIIEPKAYRLAPTVSLTTLTSFHLRAGELANFILDQIDAETFVRKGPFLNSQ
jgi:putative NADH-flavin reductase